MTSSPPRFLAAGAPAGCKGSGAGSRPGATSPQEVAAQLSWYEGRRNVPHGQVRIWPIVETAIAVRDAAAIAAATPRIAYMGGGTAEGGDLARDVGFQVTAEGAETLYIHEGRVVDTAMARTAAALMRDAAAVAVADAATPPDDRQGATWTGTDPSPC